MDYFDKAKDPNWTPRRMLPTWKVVAILVVCWVAFISFMSFLTFGEFI